MNRRNLFQFSGAAIAAAVIPKEVGAEGTAELTIPYDLLNATPISRSAMKILLHAHFYGDGADWVDPYPFEGLIKRFSNDGTEMTSEESSG